MNIILLLLSFIFLSNYYYSQSPSLDEFKDTLVQEIPLEALITCLSEEHSTAIYIDKTTLVGNSFIFPTKTTCGIRYEIESHKFCVKDSKLTFECSQDDYAVEQIIISVSKPVDTISRGKILNILYNKFRNITNIGIAWDIESSKDMRVVNHSMSKESVYINDKIVKSLLIEVGSLVMMTSFSNSQFKLSEKLSSNDIECPTGQIKALYGNRLVCRDVNSLDLCPVGLKPDTTTGFCVIDVEDSADLENTGQCNIFEANCEANEIYIFDKTTGECACYYFEDTDKADEIYDQCSRRVVDDSGKVTIVNPVKIIGKETPCTACETPILSEDCTHWLCIPSPKEASNNEDCISSNPASSNYCESTPLSSNKDSSFGTFFAFRDIEQIGLLSDEIKYQMNDIDIRIGGLYKTGRFICLDCGNKKVLNSHLGLSDTCSIEGNHNDTCEINGHVHIGADSCITMPSYLIPDCPNGYERISPSHSCKAKPYCKNIPMVDNSNYALIYREEDNCVYKWVPGIDKPTLIISSQPNRTAIGNWSTCNSDSGLIENPPLSIYQDYSQDTINTTTTKLPFIRRSESGRENLYGALNTNVPIVDESDTGSKDLECLHQRVQYTSQALLPMYDDKNIECIRDDNNFCISTSFFNNVSPGNFRDKLESKLTHNTTLSSIIGQLNLIPIDDNINRNYILENLDDLLTIWDDEDRDDDTVCEVGERKLFTGTILKNAELDLEQYCIKPIPVSVGDKTANHPQKQIMKRVDDAIIDYNHWPFYGCSFDEDADAELELCNDIEICNDIMVNGQIADINFRTYTFDNYDFFNINTSSTITEYNGNFININNNTISISTGTCNNIPTYHGSHIVGGKMVTDKFTNVGCPEGMRRQWEQMLDVNNNVVQQWGACKFQFCKNSLVKDTNLIAERRAFIYIRVYENPTSGVRNISPFITSLHTSPCVYAWRYPSRLVNTGQDTFNLRILSYYMTNIVDRFDAKGSSGEDLSFEEVDTDNFQYVDGQELYYLNWDNASTLDQDKSDFVGYDQVDFIYSTNQYTYNDFDQGFCTNGSFRQWGNLGGWTTLCYLNFISDENGDAKSYDEINFGIDPESPIEDINSNHFVGIPFINRRAGIGITAPKVVLAGQLLGWIRGDIKDAESPSSSRTNPFENLPFITRKNTDKAGNITGEDILSIDDHRIVMILSPLNPTSDTVGSLAGSLSNSDKGLYLWDAPAWVAEKYPQHTFKDFIERLVFIRDNPDNPCLNTADLCATEAGFTRQSPTIIPSESYFVKNNYGSVFFPTLLRDHAVHYQDLLNTAETILEEMKLAGQESSKSFSVVNAIAESSVTTSSYNMCSYIKVTTPYSLCTVDINDLTEEEKDIRSAIDCSETNLANSEFNKQTDVCSSYTFSSSIITGENGWENKSDYNCPANEFRVRLNPTAQWSQCLP
ncbi:MAG: hypothetical protein JJV96_02090 [Alphaproteobacteria bacterium]|nr:hypothetical protein [Alphaproteobacteria bacterium]